MTRLTEAAIRAMPYEQRLKNYNMEKNELFYKTSHLPAEEMMEKHQELIRKWRV